MFGVILGCAMGNVVSMPLCRIYYFSSLNEALDLAGRQNFIYCKSGGDDAILIAWNEQAIERMHACLNELPDGWTYELRKPTLTDSVASLPFFDVLLLLKNNFESTEWWFETGIYFKPADRLCRTHADSWWSWDHAEALIRSHLDRTARICSTTELAAEALCKLGWMLARRQHTFENLILSLKRLRTVFLAECDSPSLRKTPP